MKKLSKYIFSLIISTGFLLSVIPKPSIVYNCNGTEVFPNYFGSPFIYKSTSLATSMSYDFYLLGIVANVIIWSLFILLVRHFVVTLVAKIKFKWARYTYQISKYSLTILCIASTYLSIHILCETITLQASMDSDAKAWDMTCTGQFQLKE